MAKQSQQSLNRDAYLAASRLQQFELNHQKGETQRMTQTQNLTETETVETVEHPGKIAAEKRAEMERNLTQSELPTPPKFELIQTPNVGKVVNVPLSSLLRLDATPIENADMAMRERNQTHLEHLRAEFVKGADFPPIKIAWCKLGNVTKAIVVGGYHRWEIYEDDCLSKVENPKDKLQVAKARDSYTVKAEEVAVNNSTELLHAAFEDNMKHGLAMNDTSRCRYGIFLWNTRGRLPKNDPQYMSMRQIAAFVGLKTHATISRQIARDEEKAARAGQESRYAKMVDGLIDEEIAKEIEAERETLEQRVLDTTNRHATAFVKALDGLAKDENLDSSQVIVEYLRDYFSKAEIDSAKLKWYAQALNQLAQKPAKKNGKKESNGSNGKSEKE